MDEFKMKLTLQKASTNRYVYNESLFDMANLKEWERAYRKTIDEKYRKNIKNYSAKIVVAICAKTLRYFLFLENMEDPVIIL